MEHDNTTPNKPDQNHFNFSLCHTFPDACERFEHSSGDSIVAGLCVSYKADGWYKKPANKKGYGCIQL